MCFIFAPHFLAQNMPDRGLATNRFSNGLCRQAVGDRTHSLLAALLVDNHRIGRNPSFSLNCTRARLEYTWPRSARITRQLAFSGHSRLPLALSAVSITEVGPLFPNHRGPAVRNTYLVCYDICDDKRLRKVYKTMRDFGDHLQYSVFECQFTPIDLARCRHILWQIIKRDVDQVLFVNLGPSSGRGERVISAIGVPYSPIDAPCIVV